MLLKQKFVYLLLGLVVLLVLIVIRFAIIGGDEDGWVCESGTWVKHGQPTTSQPTTPCKTKIKNVGY